MNGDIDGVGDIATGGLMAVAVDPPTGTHEGQIGGACLNCATILTGSYCYNCGQKGRVHRTISSFWHDFTHSILHFDGKIWRTLPLLIWKPGELTRRYIHGERAKFVSPLAMFLFSVFLLFASFSFGGNVQDFSQGITAGRTEPERAATVARVDAAIAKTKAEMSALIAQDASVPGEDAALKSALSRHEIQLKALGIARRAAESGADVDISASFDPKDWKGAETGVHWLDAAIDKAAEDPQLLFYKLKSNGYKFSWALIPLSVPFVWLLFAWRREFRVFDHAVFVTYSLCFMSILFAAMTINIPNLGETIMTIGLFYVPIHMHRHLKGAYLLSNAGAFVRLPFLLAAAFIAMTLEFFLLLLLGLG